MTKFTPTIAITGASGFLGNKLLDHFLDKGWCVIALVRDPSTQKRKHDNLVFRKYDIVKPISKTTLKGCEYLVHAAYIKLSPEPSKCP